MPSDGRLIHRLRVLITPGQETEEAQSK
jgi:hypothetical protein